MYEIKSIIFVFVDSITFNTKYDDLLLLLNKKRFIII